MTPEGIPQDGRDRGIDALRALAVAGVVLGHWLVTAVVPGGVASPLRYLPGLTPVSWLLQTLAVFFLVGGFAAARARAARVPVAQAAARDCAARAPVTLDGAARGSVAQAAARAHAHAGRVGTAAQVPPDPFATAIVVSRPRPSGGARPPAPVTARPGPTSAPPAGGGTRSPTVRTGPASVLKPAIRSAVTRRGTPDPRRAPAGRDPGGHTGRWHLRWVAQRLVRLGRPVVALLGVWIVVVAGLIVVGVEAQTVRAVGKLVLSPLWFLAVYLLLTAAAPVVVRLHPGWPFAVVVTADVLRIGPGAPAAVGGVNVVAGWLVFYALGAAWARGALCGRTTLWTLLGGGTAATALLVAAAGYPAAMVGVPGAGFSNLAPPSLAVVTFGLAQCGAAGLLLPLLRRSTTAAVAVVNRHAITVFLWHQSAMLAVTAAALAVAGPLPGLHTRPDDVAWVVARVAWLPLFCVALLLCCGAAGLVGRPQERRRRGAA